MDAIGPFGFSGGLNTKAGIFTLPKDQMSAAQNVFTISGVLNKLLGSAAINASALNSGAVVTGIADWQTVAQARYLLTICGNKIYAGQNLATAPSDITGAATITAGQNNQHTFASLNNILAICGGTTPDTPLQWTGVGNVASLAGSPPTGSLVTVANNFMFISGIAATPSTVYWSNVGDPGTWASANFIEFRKSDGDIVTAIAPLGYSLVIFKRRSTGIFYTQTQVVSGSAVLGPLTQVNVQTGCCGSQGWDTLPDGRLVVFGSDAHLRIFDGTNFIDISDPPYPHSNIQPNLDAMNATRIPFACVRVYPTRNQIWLSISSFATTVNDTIFIYDYKQESWQCWTTNRAANVFTTSIDTRATPHHPIVILSGNYGGFVYEHDTGATNAEVADSSIDGYATCCIPLGVESKTFIPDSLRVAREAQISGQITVGWGFNSIDQVNLSATVDETQPGAVLDSFVLDTDVLSGSSTLISGVPTPSSATAFMMTVQFRNAFASQPFQIHPFMISGDIIT